MFVLRQQEKVKSRVAVGKHAQQKSQEWAEVTPISGTESVRKVCPCGGGCPRCASSATAPPLAEDHLPSSIQRKLEVGAVEDPRENEADRVADHVLAMPMHPDIGQSSPRIQRYSSQPAGEFGEAPSSVAQIIATPGQPLDPGTRAFMESRFGYDFSGVRVHSGTAAEQSAREVHALAYTVGRDIVFGAGRFAPGTRDGRRLIAHELTHVVQSGSESSRINSQAIYRQMDDAQIEAEIQTLRQQLMLPVNPLRPVQQARLLELEAMLYRSGGGARQAAPARPKPRLDEPFMFRFSSAWEQAKAAAQQRVREADKALRDSSISRGFMHVQDLAPSADEVWKTGIHAGLFKNDERDQVEEFAGKWASQSYSKRYESAKYGSIYGDERYYESSGAHRTDDAEVWSRGRAYGLFLSNEKAGVLNISAISIASAAWLNAMANTTATSSPQAAKLMDEIHNFTQDEGVVLLGPEMEKLFGEYGYKYRDEADRWAAADAINKAYQQQHQCLKDPNATVADRWNESLTKRGFGANNLEQDHYNTDCFKSRSEYDAESSRRSRIYEEEKQKCQSERGIKMPKLSRTQPDWVVCENRVDAEFYPSGYRRLDYQRTQANNQLQKIDDVINSGAIATVGRLAGYTAAKITGHDDDEALEWSEKGALVGEIGDFALAVKAGTTARAASQKYNDGGRLVVSRDAQVTQTVTRPAAADPAEHDTATTSSVAHPPELEIHQGGGQNPTSPSGKLSSLDDVGHPKPRPAAQPLTRPPTPPKTPVPAASAHPELTAANDNAEPRQAQAEIKLAAGAENAPVMTRKGGQPPRSSSAPKTSGPGGAAKPEPDSVWIQLHDGQIREFKASEVRGRLKAGANVKVSEGEGRIVGIGSDPPSAAQVSHEPPQKPDYVNPGHHDPTSGVFRGRGATTTSLPQDAEEVFSKAIPGDPEGNTWYGKNSHGDIYRFAKDHDGKAHFNGSTNSARGLDDIPTYVLNLLGKK